MLETILKFIGGFYIGMLFVMPVVVIMMLCVLVRAIRNINARLEILETNWFKNPTRFFK